MSHSILHILNAIYYDKFGPINPPIIAHIINFSAENHIKVYHYRSNDKEKQLHLNNISYQELNRHMSESHIELSYEALLTILADFKEYNKDNWNTEQTKAALSIWENLCK